MNRRAMSVGYRVILMSDIKYRERRDKPPPRRSENKDARVNRPHNISTDNVQSISYGSIFIQRFRPDANFLATRHLTDLEHKVNIQIRS